MLHLLPFMILCASVDLAGDLEEHPKPAGQATHYRLTADVTFGWRLGVVAGDVDLNGHTLTMDTGGGNVTRFTGVITGDGSLVWKGGGSDIWQTKASYLAGDRPNTFTGTLTITQGTLAFAKPANTHVFAGKSLVLGGGGNQAIALFNASHQLPDDCNLLITGKHEGRLWMQGHSETLGALNLQSHASIRLGDGASILAFADSSTEKWNPDSTLTIDEWTQGKERITFGKTARALTDAQIARIGFADPQPLPPGLYAARLTDTGELVPTHRVEAKHPPFDLSDKARAARRALYESDGLTRIAAKDSPLRDGMTVSFFGDSITWQNQYISRIGKALAQGEGTREKKIRLINHGINGGGVITLRDGSDKAAYVSPAQQDGPQAPFADVIAKDKADVAVVLIGINDVWWRNTKPEEFTKALTDLAAAAKRNNTRLVLATLTAIGEKPDGSNPKDKALHQFADLTRQVAKQQGVTLIDLRAVFLAYLQNHNARLRIDGSLVMRESGLLTHDGVHPSDTGNDLLAAHLAAGVVEALRSTE